MGNTARVLGIVLISMVLGLTSLFLLLFTICGGFRHAGGEEAFLLAVCVAILGGGVTGIVFLARGITTRPAGPGLAVAPAVAAEPAPGAPAYQPAARTAQAPRLRATDSQWLLFLRLALGAYICMIVGSTALGAFTLAQYGAAVVFPSLIGSLISIAPALLALLLLRDPPSGLVLDLAGGMAAGSIVFRLLWTAYMSLVWSGDTAAMPQMLARLAVFTAIESAIVVFAWILKRIVAPGTAIRFAAIAVAFMIWEWISQTLVGLLYRFTY